MVYIRLSFLFLLVAIAALSVVDARSVMNYTAMDVDNDLCSNIELATNCRKLEESDELLRNNPIRQARSPRDHCDYKCTKYQTPNDRFVCLYDCRNRWGRK